MYDKEQNKKNSGKAHGKFLTHGRCEKLFPGHILKLRDIKFIAKIRQGIPNCDIILSFSFIRSYETKQIECYAILLWISVSIMVKINSGLRVRHWGISINSMKLVILAFLKSYLL